MRSICADTANRCCTGAPLAGAVTSFADIGNTDTEGDTEEKVDTGVDTADTPDTPALAPALDAVDWSPMADMRSCISLGGTSQGSGGGRPSSNSS